MTYLNLGIYFADDDEVKSRIYTSPALGLLMILVSVSRDFHCEVKYLL